MQTNEFITYLTGFSKKNAPIKKRKVIVPIEKLTNTEKDLELIFQYGQNDFNNVPNTRSLSVGDVIRFKRNYYLVNDRGFIKNGTNGVKIGCTLAFLLFNQDVSFFLKKHFSNLLK